MIVSDNFIFVHNPRCGGKALRSSINQLHAHPHQFWRPKLAPYFGILLDFAHLRLWEIATLFPDVFERLASERSIVFVRDPMERFISALRWHFNMRRALQNASRQNAIELMRDFVACELSPQRILTDPLLIHFSRQKWFLTLGEKILVKHVVSTVNNPLETVQTLLEHPIATNKWRQPIPPDPDLMDDKILSRFVHEYYSPDYDLFASLPHLDMLKRNGRSS